MDAPFRIQRRDAGALKVGRGDGAGVAFYLERLMKMIPAEVVGLYLVGAGIVPDDKAAPLWGWFAFCVLAVVLIRVRFTASPSQGKGPQWAAVAISTVAFVVWVYAMGGPFERSDLAIAWLGSLMVIAWSFVVPLLYKGDVNG